MIYLTKWMGDIVSETYQLFDRRTYPKFECIHGQTLYADFGNTKVLELQFAPVVSGQMAKIKVLIDGKNEWARTVSVDENIRIPVEIPTDRLVKYNAVTRNFRVKVYAGMDDKIYDEEFAMEVMPVAVQTRNLTENVRRIVRPREECIAGIEQEIRTVLCNTEICGLGLFADNGIGREDSVLKQLQCIYEVIQSKDIVFEPNASTLAQEGPNGPVQVVKSQKQLLDERLGNCLDFSCLFAAVFMRCGFHPLIVYTQDHALVGIIVSTLQYNFRYGSCIESSIAYNNRDYPIGAIFLDCTYAGKGKSFQDAVNEGYRIMYEEKDPIFRNGRYTVLSYPE